MNYSNFQNRNEPSPLKVRHFGERLACTSFIAICLWLIASASAYASPSEQPLFANDRTIDAVLSVPLAQAYDQKGSDQRLYLDGSFSYKTETGETFRTPIKVKTRGNFRREICNLPPLRLNFRKKAVKDTLLDGQDKMKLVGPCQPGGIYKDLVVLEHLAYEIFATVSEYALETRSFNLSYVDLDKKIKPRTTSAFLIEDIKDLAKRKGLKTTRPERVMRSELDLEYSALLEIFSLLIANNDYSTLLGREGDPCCHNVYMLKAKKSSPAEDQKRGLIPVPYDFDMSGLVDAPYATPPSTVPIKKVRKRYFNGLCKNDVYFQGAIDKFKAQKSTIMRLVEDAQLSRKSIKTKTQKFIEDFFDLVDDPKRYKMQINNRCRGTVAG